MTPAVVKANPNVDLFGLGGRFATWVLDKDDDNNDGEDCDDSTKTADIPSCINQAKEMLEFYYSAYVEDLDDDRRARQVCKGKDRTKEIRIEHLHVVGWTGEGSKKNPVAMDARDGRLVIMLCMGNEVVVTLGAGVEKIGITLMHGDVLVVRGLWEVRLVF